MASIVKSRKQLLDLEIDTTYAIAELKDGRFVILDTNPDRVAVNRRKPEVLPLCHSRCAVKHSTYDEAFSKILNTVKATNEDVITDATE